MLKHYCELAASILGFAGGAILSLDALFAVRTAQEERGKESVREAVRKAKGVYVDDQGRPLTSAYDLRLWFARQSVWSARIGFSLVTAGFLFDLISKLS
jgi:hypothetical protein